MKPYIRLCFKTYVFTLFFLITGFLSCSYALMEGMSTRKLSVASGLVIRGEVIDVVSRWTEDKKAIFSTASVRVEEVVAGSCDQEIVSVVYGGGIVDGIGMKVSDSPSFEKGEIVVLFLSSDLKMEKDRAYRVYGRAQGKYCIGNDNIARKRGFSLGSKEDLVENDLPVDELIRKIKAYRNEE